jgi:MFS family permease
MTAIFGLFCGFAPSFGWLCFSLVGLGMGVGGSMPTDGTLFLENIPKTRHYLLTGLSVLWVYLVWYISFLVNAFSHRALTLSAVSIWSFSFGAVISSFLGLTILPGASCKEPPPGQTLLCNSQVDNLGWRYLLIVLGVLVSTFPFYSFG